MKREILLEIERNREIMGIKPLIMEGFSLLLTEAVDLTKLWEKIFERTTEAEVEGAISRNSRLFETGGEKLSEKIANRPRMGAGVKSIQEITEEFLQKVARQDTEKFIQMIDRLSIELPEFAIDLAIMAGENTVSYKGNSVKVYEILEKWWNLHGNEFNSVDRFKAACKSTGEALNIPPHTMKILGESVMYTNTGTSDRVVTEVMDHFGASTRRTLERTTEEGLEELLAKITEEDTMEFSIGVFEGSIVGPGGYLNIEAPTVIDYCLNRAPENIKKYFRTKWLPVKSKYLNTKIKVPFVEVENSPLLKEELELIKGTIGKMKSDKFTTELENEINKHVERKMPKGFFKKMWGKFGCYGMDYSWGEWLKGMRSTEYTGKMVKEYQKKRWCQILHALLWAKVTTFLILDVGMNIPGYLKTIYSFFADDIVPAYNEMKKQAKGTLTAEDTDIIELFYKQHEESRDDLNHRFNEEHDNYFEVRVNERTPTMYDQEAVSLSDWQIVIFNNGTFTLKDAKTWWESIKEKKDEKVQDIKDKAGEIKNKADSVRNSQ
jgi:hypothetical protein